MVVATQTLRHIPQNSLEGESDTEHIYGEQEEKRNLFGDFSKV